MLSAIRFNNGFGFQSDFTTLICMNIDKNMSYVETDRAAINDNHVPSLS